MNICQNCHGLIPQGQERLQSDNERLCQCQKEVPPLATHSPLRERSNAEKEALFYMVQQERDDAEDLVKHLKKLVEDQSARIKELEDKIDEIENHILEMGEQE